ncbi:sensor histidine kinase [Butyrivibrio sp. X503]|uniref:sensor histidine kinase n=1 Tax=Butyrivibrio sp. X503 TaxID=2364878 RepID=UPI000EA9BE52|nr:HAMP domain-containing sensor histidine kinase [Butyrivibrio sp. X503]RKM54954.1 sensor histidine kinase [Butyrivibrio sp. X503]
MRFRTKLIITSLAIVLVPVILAVGTFLVAGRFVLYDQKIQEYSSVVDYETVSDPVGSFSRMTDTLIAELNLTRSIYPNILEDGNYLQELDKRLSSKYSYIVVRKDKEIYYVASRSRAKDVLTELPTYAQGTEGVYITRSNYLLRQYDFVFSTGEPGSLFIIFGIRPAFTSSLMIYMLIAILLILLLTSILLTTWIGRSFFRPIDELNIAMQKIKDGNFDYMLPTDVKEKSEIGAIYRNYEDMRLRLKESAEEKIERERQNRELISNISHDLKTPITAIKGYSQGLLEGVAANPEKQKKYVKIIYNKANDMNNLINELTLYSSIDNNRIPYNFVKLNVSEYFGDCIEEIGADLESKSIKLNYSNLTGPDTLIVADPEQIKRVVNNIVSNSVKYLDRDDGTGQIDIRILDEVDSIRVELEDNGKGIAQKDIPNIFDRFYRTDTSRNSRQGGSGIGLSIVKKIIEDHGGYIWATSHEGEGTCMHFVLRKYIEYAGGSETVTVDHES